jgi:hypothetical protein
VFIGLTHETAEAMKLCLERMLALSEGAAGIDWTEETPE